MNSATASALIRLLYASLHTSERGWVDSQQLSVCWPELYRLAVEQGVLAVAWEGLNRLLEEQASLSQGEPRRAEEGNSPENEGNTQKSKGDLCGEIALLPDRKLRLKWGINVAQIEARYAKQRAVIGKLASFYAHHGIRMMLLKGYGLSLLYPTPEHRPCGDIDIWLFGEQERADKLLREEKGIRIAEGVHHHTTFSVEGVPIENHYDFLNIHSHRSNREIEQELKRLAQEEAPEQIEIDRATLYLPSANFNALFLLRHAAAHFAAAEIALRHLLDWALFLKHYGEKVDWGWLERICHQQNMDRLLHALTALSIDHFGLSEAGLPAIPRDAALEERILHEILSPAFSEKMPQRGILRRLWFRYRRWWANRWKHHLVYREGLFTTFLQQIVSHLRKPKSLK